VLLKDCDEAPRFGDDFATDAVAGQYGESV